MKNNLSFTINTWLAPLNLHGAVLSYGDEVGRSDNGNHEVRITAVRLLKSLYRPNLICRSTGVTLKYLSYGEVQQSLFEETKPHDDKLSHLVDELEAKFGKGIIKTGMWLLYKR